MDHPEQHELGEQFQSSNMRLQRLRKEVGDGTEILGRE